MTFTTEGRDHADHSVCIWNGKQKAGSGRNEIWSDLYGCAHGNRNSNYVNFSGRVCFAVQCRTVESVFHWSDADHFDQLSFCGNQCGISGNLPGTGKRCRVPGDFPAQTVCDPIAAGWYFFRVCQKRTGRRFADLVGVPDHRACCLPGGICPAKESQKEQGGKFGIRKMQCWIYMKKCSKNILEDTL